MKICIFARAMERHLSSFTPPMGMLAKLFSDMGHQVTVLTGSLPDGGDGVFQDGGSEVHYLPGVRKRGRKTAFWTATAARFDDLHAQRGFDLIIARGDGAYGYFRHSRFAGEVPVVAHEGTYPLWLHQMETRNSRLLSLFIPLVALLFSLEKREIRFCRQHSARVVCNSAALAKGLVRANWWHPPKTVGIPYGFDAERFAVKPPEGIAGAAPRLVFVGRLTWDKGIMQMIDILARLQRRDVVFEAIGPVSDRIRAVLVKHAAARGVADRFRMPGPVRNADLPQRLAGAAAFVFPSTHPEGLSKAVMEAMAAGLPIIAYDIPGQDTLVDHGITGWLEPPRAVGNLVTRIDALLADLPLAARIGAAGRHKIERDFAPDAMARRWDDLLQAVVADHAAGPPAGA